MALPREPRSRAASNGIRRYDQRMDRLLEAVYLVDIAARNPEGVMMGAHGLLIRRFEQAVDLTAVVVIQVNLTNAELVCPGVASVVCDLRDCLLRELQIRMEVHESWH